MSRFIGEECEKALHEATGGSGPAGPGAPVQVQLPSLVPPDSIAWGQDSRRSST